MLERLEALRDPAAGSEPPQRIGLSATQRPLDEVARFLGGGQLAREGNAPRARDDRRRRPAQGPRPAQSSARSNMVRCPRRSCPMSFACSGSNRPASSTSVFREHPPHRRAHHQPVERKCSPSLGSASDSRRRLNEPRPPKTSSAPITAASRSKRQQTEQALKDGRLRAVVATGSLELGIDMGAVDLVCQVERPAASRAGCSVSAGPATSSASRARA